MTTVKSLTAIALALAAAPGAFALSVKDDDMKLNLKMALQIRAEVNYASKSTTATNGAQTGAGIGYYESTTEDAAGTAPSTTPGRPDPADFFLRRARIGFAGTYKETTHFDFIMEADGADRQVAGATTRAMRLHTGKVEREFKVSETLKHSVRLGQYTPFFGAANYASSSEFQLATQRASNQMFCPRGNGVGWSVAAPAITWGFDIQNNTGASAQSDAEGMLYTTRVQVTPPGSWKMDKYTESWAGKEGQGVMWTFEAGINVRDVVTPTTGTAPDNETARTTRIYGTELVVHKDQLSMLAEYRTTIAQQSQSAGTSATTVGTIWLVQFGYALPMNETTVVEPAFRYTAIDLNKSGTANGQKAEFANYGTNTDYAQGSGQQFEIGLNFYFDRHKNKLGLVWQNWLAEAGPAHSNKLMAQYQLSF